MLLAAVAGGIAAALVVDTGPAAEPRTRKVLLIGIDGVRPDALRRAYTPQLDRLIERGAFAPDTQILGPRYRGNDTASAPGWASILTGVWADKHGVQGTTLAGGDFERYPDFLRRFKQAKPTARTAAFTTWDQIAHHLVPSADVLEIFSPRKRSPAGYLEADRRMAVAAGHHLALDDPDAVFVYFGLPDAIGHRSGFDPHVLEYRQAIETVDRLVGVVLRGKRVRGTFGREEWLVLVTSDHGGNGTRHDAGHRDPAVRTVFLIVSGPAARAGAIRSPTYIVDPPVTALTHLGVPVEAAWGLDGKAVGLARE